MFSFGSGMVNAIIWPCLMSGTGTDMTYNVTSGSGAPQDPGSVIHSELQMLLIELKLKTSNNVTKCLGLEMKNDQILASKMIR